MRICFQQLPPGLKNRPVGSRRQAWRDDAALELGMGAVRWGSGGRMCVGGRLAGLSEGRRSVLRVWRKPSAGQTCSQPSVSWGRLRVEQVWGEHQELSLNLFHLGTS